MLEDNFFYIAALISTFGTALFLFFIYLFVKVKANWDHPYRFNKLSIILATIFELTTIVVSGLIIQNVIINVYCWLFLAALILVVLVEFIYITTYNKCRQEFAEIHN